MTDDVRLEADGDSLVVDGPTDVVDEIATALAEDKEALRTVVEIFGPVTVVSAGTPAPWPPKGGFVPAWRRLAFRRPLIVLPTEERPSIVPCAAEPPTAPCPTCTLPPRSFTSPGPIFEARWQTCTRCGGHRWRPTDHGDECAMCGPMPGSELPPATWVRAGAGWVCGRCHPVPADDPRVVCEICGSKNQNRCRPDHDARLRQFGERLLRRTRSVKKQEQIRAALAALPERVLRRSKGCWNE